MRRLEEMAVLFWLYLAHEQTKVFHHFSAVKLSMGGVNNRNYVTMELC
jgi:hypothetical protein